MFEQMKKVNLVIEVDNADAIPTRAILEELKIRIVSERCFEKEIIENNIPSAYGVEICHGFRIRTCNYQANKLIPKLYQFIVLQYKGYLKVKAL